MQLRVDNTKSYKLSGSWNMYMYIVSYATYIVGQGHHNATWQQRITHIETTKPRDILLLVSGQTVRPHISEHLELSMFAFYQDVKNVF